MGSTSSLSEGALKKKPGMITHGETDCISFKFGHCMLDALGKDSVDETEPLPILYN